MTNAARSASPRPVHLDDVSKAIIEQLQADGRRSYADIGGPSGLSGDFLAATQRGQGSPSGNGGVRVFRGGQATNTAVN